MRRFTLPNLFLTVEGDEEESTEYQHKDTPQVSPNTITEEADKCSEDVARILPGSPLTPSSPRRPYNFPSHCPLHCPHRTFIVQDAESSRVATETVPEEEEAEEEKSPASCSRDERIHNATTSAGENGQFVKGNCVNQNATDNKATSSEVATPPRDPPHATPQDPSTENIKHKIASQPKSPKSPLSLRHGKLKGRSDLPEESQYGLLSATRIGGVLVANAAQALICTCPDSCLQDIGPQEVPLRSGAGNFAFGEHLRARIDCYRRYETSGILQGVPRDKRSHSLAVTGIHEFVGARRGLRPDSLMVKGSIGSGFVRSKFRNKLQLSVGDSLDVEDFGSCFPGTPPPQATPPVHKDIAIVTSKLAKYSFTGKEITSSEDNAEKAVELQASEFQDNSEVIKREVVKGQVLD